MPNCSTLNHVNLVCEYSAAGLSEIYIANWTSDVAISETSVVLGGTQKFYRIELPQGVGSYSDNLQVSGAARSKVHTVSFGISKVTDDVKEMIDTLALGKFVVIAHNADDQYVALGSHAGMQATEQTNTSGQQPTDEKGINVTLSCSETASAIILGAQGVQAFKSLIAD